ncbi:hypothetical protein [Pseudohalioglobus lutimaris]|uniref:DUF4148 domain-containing protein n=1 Tax=Pseudohalioglobus lutimaris TaxID=1737061 RepID=A0A2N5X8P6_9GAMM|nr:hypothetical protein [Pseudohalioglobus lutimaris]PLW70853.1 hypothetical protein C0039_01620 [Pseudohalioglobus lutimaris]
MKTYITASLAAVALLGSLHLQAHEGITNLPSTPVPGALATSGATSYGTNHYRTQYEISDLLAAVAEDAGAELSKLLGRALARKEGSKAPIADRQTEKVASAY